MNEEKRKKRKSMEKLAGVVMKMNEMKGEGRKEKECVEERNRKGLMEVAIDQQ